MKSFIRFIVIACSLFVISCSSQTTDNVFNLGKVQDGPVIVTVNDLEIHQGLLDVLGELNPRIQSQLMNPLTRKKIIDSLVDQQLLYQEAIKQGIDKSDDVTIKSLLNRHVIISNTLVENALEDEMKKTYTEKKNDEFTTVDISIIGINFDNTSKSNIKTTDQQKKDALEKIKKIKSRLDKGEDFATLAKELSDDKVSAKKGGQAGQISKKDQRMQRRGLENIIEPAFQLKKDGVSEPIETAKGYYLVKVTSDQNVIPFEDAKRTMGFELQGQVKKDLIDRLKKTAKISYVTEKEKDTDAVKVKLEDENKNDNAVDKSFLKDKNQKVESHDKHES